MMPNVKSGASHSSRFAPHEVRAGGEAPRPPSTEPEPDARAAFGFYWEGSVVEEDVVEEGQLEHDAFDYQLDLPPLFNEISPRSDREVADSPSSSTESADSVDHNDLDDLLNEPALEDEEVVEVDGEFEMYFDDSDDEDYIYDDPGAPQSPPPPLMYFGREEWEEVGSPDVGASTAAAREALRRATRRLMFH